MSDTPSPRIEGGVVHQVRLEGDASPFDVVDDDSLAPLRVGAQGPPVRFEVPVEVAVQSFPPRCRCRRWCVSVIPICGRSRSRT